jgi:hypothetical protein
MLKQIIMLSFSDIVLIIPRCNADSTVGIVCAPSLNSLVFKDLLFGFASMLNATLLVGCSSYPSMYASKKLEDVHMDFLEADTMETMV